MDIFPLPTEILCYIFDFLDNISIIFISYSCKLFRSIIINDKFWKNKKITFQKIHKIYAFREKLKRAKYVNTFYQKDNVHGYELLENNFIITTESEPKNTRNCDYRKIYKKLHEIVLINGIYDCVTVCKDKIISYCKTKVLYKNTAKDKPTYYFFDILKKTKEYLPDLVPKCITHNYVIIVNDTCFIIIDINFYLSGYHEGATILIEEYMNTSHIVYELTHYYNNGNGTLICGDWCGIMKYYNIEIIDNVYKIKVGKSKNQLFNSIFSIDDGTIIIEKATASKIPKPYNWVRGSSVYKITNLDDAMDESKLEENKIISIDDRYEDKACRIKIEINYVDNIAIVINTEICEDNYMTLYDLYDSKVLTSLPIDFCEHIPTKYKYPHCLINENLLIFINESNHDLIFYKL